MDAERAFAKRLSLAHCHAAGSGVQGLHLAAGRHPLDADEDAYRLIFVASGTAEVDAIPIRGPWSRLLRPGEIAWIAVATPITVGAIAFTARLRGGIDALNILSGCLHVTHRKDSPVIAAWERLLAVRGALRAGDPWARPRLRGLVTEVVACTVADGMRVGGWRLADRSEPLWLREVLSRIDAALADPALDVSALAAVALLSPSRFAHQFRDLLGVPPKRYLLQRRLERACSLLRDGDDAIKTIAARCGFHDADTFSEAFRRATGKTPSAWRAG